MKQKIDKLIHNLSDEITCELCDNSFKLINKLDFPFKVLKLCDECVEKEQDHLYDYVFEISENKCKKIHCPNIEGKKFEGPELTWKNLKDYLNEITDEEVLNTSVMTQEHHHFTFIRFNPIIQIRLDDEISQNENWDELRNQFERFLNCEKKDDKSYLLEHPKQFNLSLNE